MNVAPHFPLNVHVEYLWSTPLWAAELISRVLRDHGDPRTVCLAWRRSQRNAFSSGHAEDSNPAAPRIVITAGSVLTDHRHVLLHELAHILTGEPHSQKMYQVAWDLYRKYNRRNLAHSALREAMYRPSSMRAPNAPRKLWVLDSWRRWPYKAHARASSAGLFETLSELVADRPRRQRKKVSRDG